MRIRPDSYDVTDQTIGAKNQIDPKLPNSQLEWSTKRRGVTVLVGLLVKVEDERMGKEVSALKKVATLEPRVPQGNLVKLTLI